MNKLTEYITISCIYINSNLQRKFQVYQIRRLSKNTNSGIAIYNKSLPCEPSCTACTATRSATVLNFTSTFVPHFHCFVYIVMRFFIHVLSLSLFSHCLFPSCVMINLNCLQIYSLFVYLFKPLCVCYVIQKVFVLCLFTKPIFFPCVSDLNWPSPCISVLITDCFVNLSLVQDLLLLDLINQNLCLHLCPLNLPLSQCYA